MANPVTSPLPATMMRADVNRSHADVSLADAQAVAREDTWEPCHAGRSIAWAGNSAGGHSCGVRQQSSMCQDSLAGHADASVGSDVCRVDSSCEGMEGSTDSMQPSSDCSGCVLPSPSPRTEVERTGNPFAPLEVEEVRADCGSDSVDKDGSSLHCRH